MPCVLFYCQNDISLPRLEFHYLFSDDQMRRGIGQCFRFRAVKLFHRLAFVRQFKGLLLRYLQVPIGESRRASDQLQAMNATLPQFPCTMRSFSATKSRTIAW